MKKKKPKDKQKAKQKAKRRMEGDKERESLDFVRYKCLECGVEEDIPEEIVMQMDFEDGGDPTCPPRFKCEACPGQMEPIYYEGVHGYTYRFGEKIY
jgi:hypothetical protein